MEVFMQRNIYVVGAVIVENNKILCAQRGSDQSLPLLWEFPGGKIEAGETHEETLIREIKEELHCDIEVHDKVEHTTHTYDFGIVHLTTYFSKIVKGKPVLTEHKQIKWLRPRELTELNWAPADIPAIEKLASSKFLENHA